MEVRIEVEERLHGMDFAWDGSWKRESGGEREGEKERE